MKKHFLAVVALLLLSIFLAGCGCGGSDVDLVSIAVTPPESTIVMGAAQQFTATGTYSDNTAKDITTLVTWTSSNLSTATISNATGSEGKAFGSFTGTTTITATSGSISGTAVLTVVPTLVSITVAPDGLSIQTGSAQQYTATGHYSDFSIKEITAQVVWSSTAAAVASVSNDEGTKGRALALTAGATSIVATSGEISGAAGLTVTAPPVVVPTVFLVSIKVTPENPWVGFGKTIQFTATGTYSDGSTRVITEECIWTSSKEDIATISNTPGSRGLATTDHKVGFTVITATQGNISGSTTLFDP